MKLAFGDCTNGEEDDKEVGFVDKFGIIGCACMVFVTHHKRGCYACIHFDQFIIVRVAISFTMLCFNIFIKSR